MKEPALKFIKTVKQGFNNREDEENYRYNQFASILDDFFQRRISVEILVAIMESLFEGHQNLLSEFKMFLPKKNQDTESVINLCEKGEISDTKSMQQACNEFMCKVKDRFKDKFEVYTSYLEIMIQYGKGTLNIFKIYEKTFKLFFGHVNLICEFDDQDEEVQREIEKIRAFIIEDRLHEINIRWSYLRSIIKIIEGKLQSGGPEDDGTFTGLNLGRIKRLYGDFFWSRGRGGFEK